MKLPALLLVAVLLTALAVAAADPAQHLLGGAVVLAALAWRLRTPVAHLAHAVRRSPAAEEVVAPAVAPG